MLKVLTFVFLGLGIIYIHAWSSSRQDLKTTIGEQQQFLKGYAFCTCYEEVTGDTTFFSKKDVSLSIFRELSAGPPEEVYEELSAMARKAAFEIKPSIIADHEGVKPVMKGCLEFYNSKQLNEYVDLVSSMP